MLILINFFFLIGSANNVNQFLERFSEFTFIIGVFTREFLNLLEKTFVWRTGEGAKETAKPSSLLLRHWEPYSLKSFQGFSYKRPLMKDDAMGLMWSSLGWSKQCVPTTLNRTR